MSSDQNSPGFLRAPQPRTALVVSIALALLIVTVDVFLRRHHEIAIAYSIPIVLCGWSQSRAWVLALSAALMGFDLTLDYLSHPVGANFFDLHTVLSFARLAIIAALVQMWVQSLRELDRSRTSLERQNTELENVNDELRHREQETVRQSEELQSQTEELERQGEELRLTNDELSDRERMLEQLLELSRALTAELEPSEVHRKICEALGLLMDGQASAITERRGDELVLLCHHGFGAAGPALDKLPFAQSFSALIMSLGQTGYLEDVDLRKDLVIPQPKNSPYFRSVLATPLRVHGKCVGTIETYAPAIHGWSEAQISMIESLAAQASISLQSGDLIETIRQERRRFESVFRTVPFGLCVADNAEGTLVRFNPAGAAMFGVTPGEHLTPSTLATQRVLRAVLNSDELADYDELPLLKALRGEETYGQEFELKLPDNRRVTLLTSAAPIYDGKGQIAGAVCGFADISAQKSLMRELELRRREAEEAALRKTRFLASVSHDIRTPANAINLMAEVIKRTAATPEFASQIPGLAGKLQANALSLVELVSDVLDLARYDTGKIELQESEFALAELLTAEVTQLMPLAQEKGLLLAAEPLPHAIWLRSDAVKLGRVLGNLIGNAIKFTERGSIAVSAGVEDGRGLWIRVEDTGIGIAAHELPRIFDEFAQLRNPERDRYKGTGMGLAICHRLVSVMGGRIEVLSEPGKGASFTVHLPAHVLVSRWPEARPRPRSAPQRTGGLTGLRVLLVEDHAATREGTARILASEGATVSEAADAASALAALAREETDALLLDMMLPDLDGREILKAVRERRPPSLKALLVLTGDLTTERLAEVKTLGADGLIGKPISVAELVETLEAVNRRAGRDQARTS
jgi:PAS domain S-box-containing protein